MKTISSKNLILSLSLAANVGFGAYLLSTKMNLNSKPMSTAAAVKKASVEGVSLFKSNQLQGCYNALLRRQPEIDEGTVQLHMTLNTKGLVEYLELVKNDLEDEDFTKCVLSEIRGQRFPASAEKTGRLISHKFNFHRKDQGRIDF